MIEKKELKETIRDLDSLIKYVQKDKDFIKYKKYRDSVKMLSNRLTTLEQVVFEKFIIKNQRIFPWLLTAIVVSLIIEIGLFIYILLNG